MHFRHRLFHYAADVGIVDVPIGDINNYAAASSASSTRTALLPRAVKNHSTSAFSRGAVGSVRRTSAIVHIRSPGSGSRAVAILVPVLALKL